MTAIRREERISKLFAERVVIVSESGCHLWTGYANSFGYGLLRADGRKEVRAHRLAWETANGRKIPDGMVVMHKCDVPCCVNPDHLEIGTQAENMKDMGRKGRQRGGARGERQGSSKLKEKDVRLIRRMAGKFSTSEIARRFGCDPSNVRLIIAKKAWAHVSD